MSHHADPEAKSIVDNIYVLKQAFMRLGDGSLQPPNGKTVAQTQNEYNQQAEADRERLRGLGYPGWALLMGAGVTLPDALTYRNQIHKDMIASGATEQNPNHPYPAPAWPGWQNPYHPGWASVPSGWQSVAPPGATGPAIPATGGGAVNGDDWWNPATWSARVGNAVSGGVNLAAASVGAVSGSVAGGVQGLLRGIGGALVGPLLVVVVLWLVSKILRLKVNIGR